MNESCRAVREALEAETGGGDPGVGAHLEVCAACRAHAALLQALEPLASREASEETVKRIVAALPPAPWLRRRVAAWLPLAAGLALATLGLVVSGGVPAPGVVSSLPGAAGAVGGWLVSSFLDALAAARAGTDAAQAVTAAGGVWMLLWLVAAALGGSWAVVTLTGRHRGGRP